MTVRQILLLGGAALVLAACADSTAPGSQMRRGGVNADATTKQGPTTRTTTLSGTEFGGTSDTTGACRGGYVIGSGRGIDTSCSGQ